ncbi:unnamed protein product [Triticum turgidum subsp. durum]|uniref:Uncharacterized protein n=1 Tax=Triticum turgidum subsp. durum TaxID=4567 RepID=A0A9R0ZRN5_TRITD|nr:unnamed protein product [Triticum turgidum subsp. durum]
MASAHALSPVPTHRVARPMAGAALPLYIPDATTSLSSFITASKRKQQQQAVATAACASAAVFSSVEAVSAAATSKKTTAASSLRALVMRAKAASEEDKEVAALERLEEVEACAADIETGSDKVFRSILHTRVALLNIQTQTYC